MTKRYIIEATYMSGPHTGRTFLLRRGGYVCTDVKPMIPDTYATQRIASQVAGRYNARNAQNVKDAPKCIDQVHYRAVAICYPV